MNRAPKVGDRVRNVGDVCNQPADCTIIDVYTNRWGKWFDAVEDADPSREFWGVALSAFDGSYPCWIYRETL